MPVFSAEAALRAPAPGRRRCVPLLDAAVGGHHEGVVGLDHRVVVVAPEPAAHLLHAAHAADALEVAGRDQVVAAGDQALQDDLRRAFEDDVPPRGAARG